MVHKMRLLEDPFERMKNGTKTVEFRLNDDKRRKIKIGDKIEFYKLPDMQEKLVVDVLDLYIEKTFEDLFTNLYKDEKEAKRKAKSMYRFYTPEEESKYGALGIKIKINTENYGNYTMAALQKLVFEVIEKYNLETSVESRYIDLTSEIGEVGKELLKGSDYGKKAHEKTEDLELEVGDVLFSLICMSNALNIDLEEALMNVIEKYQKRFAEKGSIGNG